MSLQRLYSEKEGRKVSIFAPGELVLKLFPILYVSSVHTGRAMQCQFDTLIGSLLLTNRKKIWASMFTDI